jgi:cyclic pyranopterin phosphate synthase
VIWLQDRQNRNVKYLRVSVTDRCNLRCRYCMPEKMTFMPRSDILSFEEITTIVRNFVELGIRRVRITGGEPLSRRNIVDLIGMLSDIDGIQDLAMTTNGVLLAPMANELKQAGLTRLNISLDTVNGPLFNEMTRWGNIEPVLEGLEAARGAGFDPIKVNAVLIRGMNDGESLAELIRFTGSNGYVLRFIEYMPLGVDDFWDTKRFLSMDETWRAVESQGFRITAMPDAAERPVGEGPARYWHVTTPESSEPIIIGFIAALTHNFCEQCNRVRLTADGRVRECLTAGGRLSLRDMLRGGESSAAIQTAIRESLYGKVDGHQFDPETGAGHTYVSMASLGG